MTPLRAVLLGVATGSRSTLGLTALVLGSPHPRRGRPSWTGSRWAKSIAVLACTGELVGDKLPRTPSRLAAAPQAIRLALGGVAGGFLAHRDGAAAGRTVINTVAGVAGAAAGTYGGAWWRGRADARFGRDLPGAVIEDAVAVTLARIGAG